MVKFMKKVKISIRDGPLLASKELEKLAKETAAFEVINSAIPKRGEQEFGWDEIVTLGLKSLQQRIILYVQSRQQLLPNAVRVLLQRMTGSSIQGVPLIFSPYVSARVAEICREQNVSYIDGVGNCRIAAPGLFIHIEGRHNRPSVQKSVDPFSQKSSRIVRALLEDSKKGWQVQQLAQQAEVSLGLVSKVKTTLLEEAYLEERGRLLYVQDSVKLLHAWSAEYRPKVRRLQLFAIPRPHETEERLAEWCRGNKTPYALSQLSGAWRYSPTVRYDKSVVYIDQKLESGHRLKSLLQHLEAREVDTGSNCTLWITDDPAVFTGSRKLHGINVVSPIQLYLDLRVLAGRGEDAAQEIFDRELHPMFSKNEQPEAFHE
jgi:hypothetical protein